MPRRFRRVAFAAALLVFASALCGFNPAARADNASDEVALFNATNADRAANGLGALQYDPAASNVARAYAAHLAAIGTLVHNPDLAAQITAQVTPDWRRIGENIGYAASIPSVQNAFMNSPGHRANIMGDYNRVGVGVVRNGNLLWVVLDFVNGPALPQPSGPIGSVDKIVSSSSGLIVAGWALDPSTANSIPVHVYVDGVGYNLGLASGNRPDVGAAYPGYGGAHGYSTIIPVGDGTHSVCVYAISQTAAPNSTLGCASIGVNRGPFGSFDWVARVPSGVAVAGWAIDPDTASSIPVHVYVDGVGFNLGPAAGNRPDVAAVVPGYGAAHGFLTGIPVGPGPHTACAYGINTGAGSNRQIGCRSFTVGVDPFGSVDEVRRVGGQIVVGGWAIDPDTASSIQVHVYVDGIGYNLGSAAGARNDVASAFMGYGAAHGFTAGIGVDGSSHQVCIYAIDTGPGSNQLMSCRTV